MIKICYVYYIAKVGLSVVNITQIFHLWYTVTICVKCPKTSWRNQLSAWPNGGELTSYWIYIRLCMDVFRYRLQPLVVACLLMLFVQRNYPHKYCGCSSEVSSTTCCRSDSTKHLCRAPSIYHTTLRIYDTRRVTSCPATKNFARQRKPKAQNARKGTPGSSEKLRFGQHLALPYK